MAQKLARATATRLALFTLAACGSEPPSPDVAASAGMSTASREHAGSAGAPSALAPGPAQDSSGTDTSGTGGTSGSTANGQALGDLGAAGSPGAGAPDSAEVPGSPGGSASGDCTSLPAVADYAARGPFADARMFTDEGPGGNYTVFRPDASLGRGGFRHPLATWGNGITTTPDQYQSTLSLLASHGFVVIACNDTQAERPCLSAGLDWLAEQSAAPGPFQGKLDTSREVTIGYSWGGGAAIDTADRPNVKATVSMHGMPPRGATALADMKGPLLLFTSSGDTFVSAERYVTPNFERSSVPTFYATLDDASAGHLYVVDAGAAVCVGSLLGLGACETAAEEQAPAIAWLRYWACGDEGAARLFFGDDCTLCTPPWAPAQRKQLP